MVDPEDVCTVCAACGSADVFYDPADGWSCHSCHATDADEDGP